MNQTVEQIYDEYRDEMKRMLEMGELAPHKFSQQKFVRRFERHVERLDALISLYMSLLLIRKQDKADANDSGDGFFFFLN